MKHFQKVQWAVFIIILMMGVVGCEMFGDSDLTSPVSSTAVAPSTDMLANFWIGRGHNKFEVASENEVLQVGTPEGDYLLKYSVKMPTEDGGFVIQEFAIVFKAGEDGVFLTIGLKPGDEIWNVQLVPGEIPAEAIPVIEKDGIAIFLWPGDESSFTVEDVFEEPEGEEFKIIILIVEGEIDPVVVNNEGLEIEIEIEVEVQNELNLEQRGKHTITTAVIFDTVGGTISPERIDGVPYGASRSFKIHPNSGLFDDILDVTINGVSVIGAVKELGNGDGHLVIHDITEDLGIEVTFR